MSEPAYNYGYADERKRELIDGRIVMMSPSPGVSHTQVTANIYRIFDKYLEGRQCKVFFDSVDVRLTRKDTFIPDLTVVCDKTKIKGDGIHGAPDLVAEVLSPSTAKNDRFYKKSVYGKCGVKEYWIVDIQNLSIEVYLLKDGGLEPDNVYAIYPDYMLEVMTEEEKNAVITEFKTSIFPDLSISLDKVFKDLI
jgi:Uma2 family endonuclease